jgi:hypothetical protein
MKKTEKSRGNLLFILLFTIASCSLKSKVNSALVKSKLKNELDTKQLAWTISQYFETRNLGFPKVVQKIQKMNDTILVDVVDRYKYKYRLSISTFDYKVFKSSQIIIVY